jgi:hypothetical protein|tara:strand:+ start:400 stop:813 length:414 start_codon:yes stop_codon:yes gene_type:complete
MPAATLQFSAPLNVSCQVGDTVYYVDTTAVGGFDTNYTNTGATATNTIIEIGQIRQINNPTSPSPTIIAETSLGYNELNGLDNKFILFTKDNKVNVSSPLGYYASVKMVNDNTTTAGELFSVGAEIFGSSGFPTPVK